ncbi:synaptotagmin-1-like [Varroa jacobsoni]|uniref:synaptotagmin-1-like n=1 Tax=Varroa jacobsoni TaxID=62625 RepID=UPI000BF69D5B|nr:synaptotagmin-1-like [Varroa jacobsoni]XP_022710044.1 synaptotagmin-1-like [Varroa jacobsoni]XP_022710123.1 synaptotagmin-1-like [Varroa jacobsoni]XP_022710195.1 synaptotagmin-1-like [Varroa jacobsoni]XP_022710261.1 synaptotagmin-1-like [Varroa jacobsoni]
MAQAWNVRLTDDQKLLVIAGGFGFVAFVLAATVCFVQPTCFIYKKIWRKREKERAARVAAAKQMAVLLQLAVLGPAKLNKSQRSLGSSDNIETPGTQIGTLQARIPQATTSFQRGGFRDSTYSSMSSGSRGDTTTTISELVTDTDGASVSGEEVLSQGHATITMRFLPQPPDSKNEGIIGKLEINVKDVQELPMRPYGGPCDPYVVIQVVCDIKRMYRRKERPWKMCEFTTQIKRKAQCPLFNEGFAVPVTKSDIRHGSVHVKVYDAEKYVNHSILGEALVSLKDYDLEQETVERIVTLDLAAPTTNNGDMQLGLNYLPTSERLTVRIVKCNNVLLRNVFQQDPVVNEYVARVLLYSNGKLVKRKKTLPHSGLGRRARNSTGWSLASYPTQFDDIIIDESFMFDIPLASLDNVILVVVLCLLTASASSSDTPVTPSPAPCQNRPKDYLGKVILGSETRGPCLRHWETMKNSPRREVIQWQTLT